MATELNAARKALVAIGHSVFSRGLANGSAGNMSVRTQDGFVTTPSGVPFGELTEAGLSVLDAQGQLVEGPKPTKEASFHLAWYAANPGHNGIVHLHSPWATAVACLADVNPDDVLPPLTPYQLMKIGAMPLAPYAAPGSAELTAGLAALASGRRAVLLANHGPVCGGATLATALDCIEEVEATCRLWLTLGARPDRAVRLLPPEAVSALLA